MKNLNPIIFKRGNSYILSLYFRFFIISILTELSLVKASPEFQCGEIFANELIRVKNGENKSPGSLTL